MGDYAKLGVQERMLLKHEVEEFLFHEADLLDARRFDEWLKLLADDIHYWMPIRRTTTAKEVDREFTQPGGIAFFDDDKRILEMRVNRLSVGRAWAEDPPSRTRRLITNIRVLNLEEDEVTVACNFKLYRTRLNSEEDTWIGRREDKLRRHQQSFQLVRRHIFLEQTVILSQNMSSLF
ncbi:MAG: 3-phenylpropionate/cinnamic acid dioxygenase subunit beta [Pseudomonadota bacterium]